jgi:hypothetical protein
MEKLDAFSYVVIKDEDRLVRYDTQPGYEFQALNRDIWLTDFGVAVDLGDARILYPWHRVMEISTGKDVTYPWRSR